MPILFVVSPDDNVHKSHSYILKKLATKAKFSDFYKIENEENLKGLVSKLKQFVKETVLKYELDEFDEWNGGSKWKSG